MASLQTDLDRSANITDRYLNSVWRSLFGHEGRRPPQSWLERNNDIYERMGHVPERPDDFW